MVGSPETSEGRIRAVVVYRHALLRDVAVRVLSNAGVEVTPVHASDLGLVTLRALQPDVIVVDQAARDVFDGFGQATVFSREPGSASRVVTIGLADTTMVVCCKRLVADATAENLVEAVLGSSPTKRAESHDVG